ncbi:MAG: glycosyltransferase family 39 protein [Anaerolineae bacterium]|nr:glycosyltransferase family 39 protein [Anaerolineae bacterium]
MEKPGPETEIQEVIIPDSETRPVILPWLSLEIFLYALIFILALGLRLWNLGTYPLSNVEAQQSLLALALYRGDLPPAEYYSPLLVTLNTFTFFLIGSSDASARLAAALLGMALVLLPLTMRCLLGARVCLLASFLLAISPGAIYLSRTLNPEIGVAVGTLLVVSGFFNWATGRQRRWFLLAAVGLALMFAAGPMAFSIVLVFGLIIFVQFPAFKTLEKERSEAEDKATDTGSIPPWGQAGIFFVVALVLFSTTALFNVSGLGVLTGALPDWFNRFSFAPHPEAGFNAVFLLTIYEPLLVFSGLAGLAITLVRRSLLMVSFSLWFVGLLVLDVLMAGRPTGNVILLVTPLAFLAAFALAELWAGIQKHGAWQNEGLILAVGLVIASIGYILVTGWLTRDCIFPIPWLCQNAIWMQLIVLTIPPLLFLFIFGFFWFMNGPEIALRGLGLVGVTLGVLCAVSIGWRLNFGSLRYLPYQPLAGTPPATGLELLADTLANQSARRVGDETLLDVTLARVASPALQWQLRNYRHLAIASNLNTPTTAIITPPTDELGLDQAYFGQDFALNARWSPAGLPSKTLITWLIYRHTNELPTGDKVVLWLRLPEN